MRSHSRGPGRPLALALVAGALFLSPEIVAAQRASDGAVAGLGPEQARLKVRIESTFSILPTTNGIILVPRVARAGVQSIEIAAGGVSIDGRLVTGAELRGRLGGDAEPVVALSYFDAERLRLLFFPPGEREVEPTSPPGRPEAATPADSPEPVPTDETRRYRRHMESRIAVGRSVRVEADERVRSAVVVIGGSADVDGYVGDSVVVVGGSARLGDQSEIRGDVVVVGGTVDRQPGARVNGEVNVVGIGMPRFDFGTFYPRLWLPWFLDRGPTTSLSLFASLTRFVVFGLVAAFLVLVAGRGVERIERTAVREPWKAGLVGLLAELVMLPLLVLTIVILIISIVGIPLLLLVPFALLVVLVGFFVGFAGVAVAIGRALTRRFGGDGGTLPALLVGLAAVWGLTLVGRLVMLGGWPAWTVASIALGIGFVLEYIAWTVGFGAALLSRFGARERHPAPAAYGPPPPPPPTGPDLSLNGTGLT